MEDKALLEAIGQMMDAKLEPINKRLDRLEQGQQEMKSELSELKDDVAELKEYAEITREGVNKVAEWADNAGFLLKIPFGKPGA